MREKRITLGSKTSYPQWYDFLCLFCNTSIGFLRFLAIFSSRFCFGPTLFHFFFHFVNEIFFPYFKEHLRIRIELLAIFFVIPICLRKYLHHRLCVYTITSSTNLCYHIDSTTMLDYLHLMNLWQCLTFVIHFLQNGWSTLWRKKTRIQLLF